jgi:surface carbohydrate biosynthesis protein
LNFLQIKTAFAYLKKAKIIFRKPGSAQVLIYDRSGSNLFMNYIEPSIIQILDVRGESLNIYVIFFLVFRKRKFPTMTDYTLYYIELVNPKLIITFIDNNLAFYKLKNSFPSIITIFIQNGIRAVLGDIFGVLNREFSGKEKLHVDYMFVFGSAIASKYKEYVTGNTISIGSMKNNKVSRIRKFEKNTLIFISQFRPPKEHSPVFWEEDGKKIYWKDFYSAEISVVSFLNKFCLSKNLNFKICSVGSEYEKQELEFFQNILGEGHCEFLKKKDVFSSYSLLDAAEFVVSIDSTLGYESMARGNKVAIFSIRSFAEQSLPYPFGWPADFGKSGEFWTSINKENEFERVMNYLTNVSDLEWQNTIAKYIPVLMDYDPGNRKFIELMKKIGIPVLTQEEANHNL